MSKAHLEQFASPRSSLPFLIGLNVVRLISIVSLVLMIAANIYTVNNDWNIVKPGTKADNNNVKRHTLAGVAGVHQRDWQGLAARTEVTTTQATYPTQWHSSLPAGHVVARQESATSQAVPGRTSTAAPSATSASATASATATATASAASASPSDPAPSGTASEASVGHAGYYPDTTVPIQPGGLALSVVSRVVTMIACVVLILSEIGFPRTLFARYMVMLGPESGLGWLGLLQAIVASGVLSHYCKAFLRVASWMLLSIGVINMALGFMREKAKVKRSFSFENVANATPQTKAAAAVAVGGYSVFKCLKRKHQERKAEKNGREDGMTDVYAPGATGHGYDSRMARKDDVEGGDWDHRSPRPYAASEASTVYDHQVGPKNGRKEKEWDDGMSEVYLDNYHTYVDHGAEAAYAQDARKASAHTHSRPERTEATQHERGPDPSSILKNAAWGVAKDKVAKPAARALADAAIPKLPKAAQGAARKAVAFGTS